MGMADTGERLRESKMTEEKLHVKEELGCRCTGMDALSLLLAGGRAARYRGRRATWEMEGKVASFGGDHGGGVGGEGIASQKWEIGGCPVGILASSQGGTVSQVLKVV